MITKIADSRYQYPMSLQMPPYSSKSLNICSIILKDNEYMAQSQPRDHKLDPTL